MDSLELWSIWKDRSKELFTLSDLPLEDHERKDILEQFERIITEKMIKKNDNKQLESFGKLIDKQIENKEFERKIINPIEEKSIKYKNLWLFFSYTDGEDFEIQQVFLADSKKSIIDYILGDIKLFEKMFILGLNDPDIRKGYQKHGFIDVDDFTLNLGGFEKTHIIIDWKYRMYFRYFDINESIKEKIAQFHLDTNRLCRKSIENENKFKQIKKERRELYMKTFCIPMSVDEMIEIIFKFYQENPQILLQSILDSDDFSLCNVMSEYRFLRMKTEFFKELATGKYELIICNKDLPIKFDYKVVKTNVENDKDKNGNKDDEELDTLTQYYEYHRYV